MDLWKYREWTVDQTCQYLEEQGLGEWQAKFRENNISGVTLQYLTEQHLKDMDIRQIGDRLKILDSIRKLWQITAQGKVFNDPIHGHIELHPLLIKIIDTPQFQRLRNIRQLGGAYFVYPGASHNRFEHSLGVAYLAGELVDALSRRQPELQINPSDILCVQFAGLCHDLGE
ncbi:deoxynucleoside triphosphate triphosphohydrolase SAMHD1-like [Mastacembelus armatus]|uniref:deoxynucleoside triphosphate triphosphohydrolase SAMHD1-like n=1 Tax=Mastacembelus armatus TaxID=205130 RepID=UPI000E453CB8|nr:deoxynucleoside triphosphate triphosphohydrolase SAMHD1-like [Mastacembelus armatus]